LSPKWLAVPLIGACFCLLVSTARADVLTFGVELDGFQEVPPNSSPGVGDADLTLDDVSGYVNITSGSYQDLLGNSSAVSINGPAGYGTNAAVLLVLTLTSPGTTSGTFSGNGTLSGGNITDMINTNTYINIRSNVYPSGEIRGEIVLVPEPTSAALVCLGLSGLLMFRRRRK